MDFNDKHLATIDNLLKFLPRCRPPEDATLEESFVFAQSYYFLYDLKKHVEQDLLKKKQQAAAMQSMATANNPGLAPNNIKQKPKKDPPKAENS